MWTITHVCTWTHNKAASCTWYPILLCWQNEDKTGKNRQEVRRISWKTHICVTTISEKTLDHFLVSTYVLFSCSERTNFTMKLNGVYTPSVGNCYHWGEIGCGSLEWTDCVCGFAVLMHGSLGKCLASQQSCMASIYRDTMYRLYGRSLHINFSSVETWFYVSVRFQCMWASTIVNPSTKEWCSHLQRICLESTVSQNNVQA